jgi:hypothetical protein
MTYVASKYPRSQWKTSMGDYWPAIGYCTAADFETSGAGCIAAGGRAAK